MRKGRFLVLSVVMILIAAFSFAQQKTVITIQDYLQPGYAGRKIMNEILNEYEKAHPNVVIHHVYVPFASLMQKILEEKLTGTLPDIVWADNPMVPSLIKAGIFMNIKPFIKDWPIWKEMYAPYKELVSVGNKVYGLQVGTNNVALFYNGKLLKEAGISKLPQTWNELMNVCKVLKSKFGKEGIYPIGFSAAPEEECTWQFEPFLWSSGGNLLKLNSANSIKALQLWTTLVKKGYAPREVVNWHQGDVGTMFANGKLAMMINGCWEFGWHVLPSIRKKYDVGVTEIPIPSNAIHPIVPFGGEIYGVSSTESKEKLPVVLDLMKFIFSPRNITKFERSISYIPVSGSVVSEFEKELKSPEMEKLLSPFLSQAKYAVARTVAGGGTFYPQISSIVWNAIQRSLIGSQSPAQSFEEAYKKIKNLFPSKAAYIQAYQKAKLAMERAMK